MPTLNQSNFRRGLIGLGIVALLATGIATYFARQRDYLTWEEMQAVIRVYNLKLEQIRDNCETDARCVEVDGVKKVRFENVRSDRDIIQRLNQWIEDDAKVD